MAIQAPYKGRDEAPAQADKADAVPADKLDAAVEESPALSADKRVIAPTELPEADDEQEVPEVEEEEQEPEAVDPDLILMRADYTRGKMKLADERRQVEAKEAELANRYGVYERVDQLIAQNPELAKSHSVEQLVSMLQSPDPIRQSGISPEARREISELRQEVADTKKSLFEDRVESAVKRVTKAHGLQPKQVKQLLEMAVGEDLLDYQTPPEKVGRRLEILARAMTYKNAEAKGQTKLVDKLKAKQRAATGGTTATPQAPTTTARPKGWEKLIAAHKARASG